MIEQLLTLANNKPPYVGNVLMLYDPETNTDLSGNGAVSTLYTGMAATDAYLIDGFKTLVKPTSSARQLITFPTPLNLSTHDWTLEWQEYNTEQPPAGDYRNEIILDSNVSGRGLYARYGDGGFASRMYLGDPTGSADPNKTWPTQFTKASLLNSLSHWAIVQYNSNIYLFRNGIRQMLAFGYGVSTYDKPYMTTQPLAGIYQMRLGAAAASTTVKGVVGYQGRIRLSDWARYTSNYTPKPLTL